ncbi:leucine-rich repeat domain-containing protein [Blautia glucerasea]|uniref:leucine-rich repeat domain-containing protein n=1 Tax=Blautia glucerasea TaxID=536633 RepID=UPI00157068E7|nr:leucine-rich repeat protein [Blautia glucerasea]NSJ28346.1 leucine-rich repeat protein [Blautia glucerasea]
MKKKVLSVILSVAMLAAHSVSVSILAEEVGFTDGVATEETTAPEESGVQDVEDVGNEASDQSEETPDIIEEVSDSGEEALLFEDSYDEAQDDDRQVELLDGPEKDTYFYEEVESVDDFDLTGLRIRITTNGSEEFLSFSQNGERKQDSKGNYYECKISAEGTDDTAEIIPGEYIVSIKYGNDSSETYLCVLQAVSNAINAIRQENGIYTATVEETGVVKLIPEESGEFTIVDMVKPFYPYGTEEKGEGWARIVDGQSMEFMESSTLNLEKGKVYYLYPWNYMDYWENRNVHSVFINPVNQENSGVCGENAFWKIENGVMTISGSGPTYGSWGSAQPWITDAEEIVIEEGITSIGSFMFSGFKKLKSVQIAESVEKIGSGAFYWCENLQNIFIPKNVKKLGDIFTDEGDAFSGTTNKFDHIEVDKDNPYYSAVDGILYNKDQTGLIFVPGGKTEYNISAKVVSLFGVNFADMNLDSASFWFHPHPLVNSVLQNIMVAPDNPVFTSVNGVLYTKDKSMLLICPPKKKNLVVAEETKVIGIDAFSGCEELVSVSLPDGLEKICMDGFSDCTNLKEIEIPENTKLEYDSITKKDITLLKVHANSDGERYARENGFRYEIIHTHNWDAGVVTKVATCTEAGIRTYTCSAGGETRTEIIPAAGHKYGAYTVTKEPTIFAAGIESRECAVCHNREERELPKPTAQVKLVSKTLPMQVKKSVSGQKLIADKDPSDSIASLTTSNGKVVAVNNKTFKITAKKAGKAVITVTMKSGATSRITVNVKKVKVAATKITGVKKKITIKKGKKLTLKPVLSPITSTVKLAYSSSDEEIATVSSKGVIKAIKKGKVKVKVKAGKKTVTCVVTVK